MESVWKPLGPPLARYPYRQAQMVDFAAAVLYRSRCANALSGRSFTALDSQSADSSRRLRQIEVDQEPDHVAAHAEPPHNATLLAVACTPARGFLCRRGITAEPEP